MTHQETEQSGVMRADDFARKWMVEAYAHFTWRGDTRITTITPSKEDVVKALNERDSQIRAERDAEVKELVECLEAVKKEAKASLDSSKLYLSICDEPDSIRQATLKIRKKQVEAFVFKLDEVISKHTKPKGE